MKVIIPVDAQASFVSTNVPETEYFTWGSGTTYVIGDTVIYNHHIYQSLQNSNLNKIPSSEPTYWAELGPTNAWACIDSTVGSVTSQAESFNYQFTPGRIDSIALLDLSANTVNVKLTLPDTTVVYDQTFATGDTALVTDWYQYFFTDVQLQSELVVENIPIHGEATASITVNAPNGIAKLGTILLGFTKTLGSVQFGVSAGINDYSKKEVDSFGRASLIKRTFSKRLDAQIHFESSLTDQVFKFLSEIRATPVLWIGAQDSYSTLTVYGFYKDFNIDISFPTVTYCSLTIEGLA